jgi:hypothetical protein
MGRGKHGVWYHPFIRFAAGGFARQTPGCRTNESAKIRQAQVRFRRSRMIPS